MPEYEYVYQVLFDITNILTDDIDDPDLFENCQQEKPYQKEMTIRKFKLVEKLEDFDIFEYWNTPSHKYKYCIEQCTAIDVLSMKKVFFNDTPNIQPNL